MNINEGLTQDDLNEDCPILMQKDFNTTIKTIAELPDYLRKINENIINIDKRISKKELNTDKVKQLNIQHSLKENKSKCSHDLSELKDIVKQSVDGLHDILGMKRDLTIIETIEEEINVNKNMNLKGNKDKEKTPKASNGHINNYINPNTSYTPNDKRNVKKTILHSNTTKSSTSNNFGNSNGNNSKIKMSATHGSAKSNYYLKDFKEKRDTKELKGKLNQTIDTSDINNNNHNNTTTTITNHHLSNNDAFNQSNIRFFSNNSKKNITTITVNPANLNIPNHPSSKEKKISKSPNNKNNFRFKPKAKRESINDISGISETHKKNSSITTNVKGTSSAIKSTQQSSKIAHPVQMQNQRVFTEQSKPSSTKTGNLSTGKQIDRISISRKQFTTPFNSKNKTKKPMTQDILRLMLFFNEYILNSNVIKDTTKNLSALEKVSVIISKALKETTDDNTIEMPSIDNEEYLITNDRVIDSVVKLQRKWRRFKLKEIIRNTTDRNTSEKSLLKKMIVNNFIDKESFAARKIVGMINTSIESFFQMESNEYTASQLTKLNLNKLSSDERYLLYKNYISTHLENQSIKGSLDSYAFSNAKNRNEAKQGSLLNNLNISETKTK